MLELKYCPYGPLVEQSPTLPTRRKDVEEQRGYFEECLKSGLVGNVVPLADEWRDLLEQWCQDEQLLLQQAYTSIVNARRLSMAETLETEEEQIDAWLGSGRLPLIQVYRTQFEYGNDELAAEDFSPEEWAEIESVAAETKAEHL